MKLASIPLRSAPCMGVVLLLLVATTARAASPQLVKDIWPGVIGSDPSRLTALGDRLIFTASDGIAGEEPWATDGTTAGTVLLRDIRVGSGGSGIDGGFIIFDGQAYFNPFDGDPGRKFWRTDGTPGGTAMFYDFGSGSAFGNPSTATVHSGRLYFFAHWGSSAKLSSTDGTVPGTAPIQANPSGGLPQAIGPLPASGATFFFSARSDVGAPRVWTSDGTTAGTIELPGTFYPGTNIGGMGGGVTAGPGGLYFSAGWGDSPGSEPWFSDGTAAGTRRLVDACPGGCSSHPSSFLATSAGVLFTADAPSTGRELWITDGTVAGTRLFEDTTPGPLGASMGPTLECGSTIYLVGDRGGTGVELHALDAIGGTMRLVRDIQPGPGSSEPSRLHCIDETLFFVADDGVSGREIWTSDGTDAGTIRVADICPGLCSSVHPGTWTVAHEGFLYAGLQDPAHGMEIWRTDGTAAGTDVFADVSPGGAHSWPSQLVFVGNRAYFTATAAGRGTELWTLDIEDPPPVIHPPADASMECAPDAMSSAMREAWLALAVAEGGCGDAEVRHELVRRDEGCGESVSEVHAFWAVDRCGLESERVERTFALVDSTLPSLVAPSEAIVECAEPATLVLAEQAWLAAATASDDCGAATVHHAETARVRRCGNTYEATHEFWAVDECGNESSRVARTFSVADTTPPSVAGMLTASMLWPPDHAYRVVRLADLASATDACGSVGLQITGCASNQPEDAPDGSGPNGDGHTLDDCVVALDGALAAVRSERLGGCGRGSQREYVLRVVATDACGNEAALDASIRVPHDRPTEPELHLETARDIDALVEFDPTRVAYGTSCR